MREHREKRRNKEQNRVTRGDLLTLADVRLKTGNFLMKTNKNIL